MFDGFTLEEIDIEGSRVRLRRGGEGPPLLLIHGCPETGMMWGPISDGLARHFTVYAPDLRGYGGSAMPETTADHEPYSKRAMNRDLVGLMRHFGHDRFRVAGHDRGARCAYRMALDHPERVERLIVMDIIPTGEAYARTDFAFAKTYSHWFFLLKPAPFPERMLAGADDGFHFLGHVKDLISPQARAEYGRYNVRPENIHGMCEDYRAGAGIDRALDDADKAAGRRIAAPTLVMWGARGFVATQDPMAIWRDWADDVRGVAVDCGHFLPEEKPAETLAAMLDFLLD